MEQSLKDKIITGLCKYYYCSDSDDNQYPKCNIWGKSRCNASPVVEIIEPLLEHSTNQNSAELAETAKTLEAYLVEKCVLPGFDIPDEIWIPFEDAIKKVNSLPCGENNDSEVVCPRCKGKKRVDVKTTSGYDNQRCHQCNGTGKTELKGE